MEGQKVFRFFKPGKKLFRAAENVAIGAHAANGANAENGEKYFVWFGLNKNNVMPYKNNNRPIREYTTTKNIKLLNLSLLESHTLLKKYNIKLSKSFVYNKNTVKRRWANGKEQEKKNVQSATALRKIAAKFKFDGWIHNNLVTGENPFITQNPELMIFEPNKRGVSAIRTQGSPCSMSPLTKEPSRKPTPAKASPKHESPKEKAKARKSRKLF